MQWMQAHRERHSDDGKPPVPWERYLEVAPDLSTLDPAERPEALAARELDPDTWARAESYWTLTFAIDLQAGRSERMEAYGRACAEAKAKVAARPAEDVEVTPAKNPAAPEQAARSLPADSGATAAPALVVPLAAEAVAALDREGAKELPSFLRAAGTPALSALPLSPTPAPAPIPAPPEPAVLRLPSPAPQPAPGAARKVFDATLDIAPGQAAPAVPFGRLHSPEFAARLRSSPAAPTPARRDRHDATVMAPEPAAGPATPFGKAAGQAKMPELTLEQHAMLTAELAAQQDGPSRAAVLGRYGVGGVQQLAALSAHWRERLERDPAAAARWKAVHDHHRAHHQGRSR